MNTQTKEFTFRATNQKGYWAVGVSGLEQAKSKIGGIQIYMTVKPNLLKRLANEYLLGIYWVDEER